MVNINPEPAEMLRGQKSLQMIYFDNNATTPIDPRVVEAMRPFLEEHFANPSSPYMAGRLVSNAMAEAREQVAALVGAAPSQVFFTSGGTESNNTALSYALALPERPRMVTSSVEHTATRNYCKKLEENKIQIKVLDVGRDGALDEEALRLALDERVGLVSVMAANNETGVLFPIERVAGAAHAVGALLHTDAVQAAGKIPVDLTAWDVDFLSLSAHKIHGPKGIGALVVRSDLTWPTLLRGGDQEQGRRPGTENVPGIIGMGEAARILVKEGVVHAERMGSLRDQLERDLVARVKGVEVVAATADRLPNTTTLLFSGLEAEAILALLDMEGLCCSSGSACTAGSVEPSHVLLAMGFSRAEAQGAIRFSLNRLNTVEEVETAVDKVAAVVDRLRGHR